jgi:soluble lytic murein transglycosylase-like protein
MRLPLKCVKAGVRAAIASVLFLIAVRPAGAETVVLRSGQSLSITGYEQKGDVLLLQMAGGMMTIPAAEVERIEPQVEFAPNPAPVEPPLEVSIRETAERYGVDPDLLSSVIAVESRFDPHAVSRKNAKGLMQLMPATSARLGVGDVFDARQNLEGGARYLRELLDRYHQDVRLALAAYNAGPGPVDRLRTVPYIPETRQYVELVLRQWNARRKKSAPSPAS